MTKINFKSFYQDNIKNNVKDGKNDFNYYFVYYNLFLNHNTLLKVQNALGAGFGGVASVISYACECPLVGVVAAVLIAQWYIWNIPSYDNGSGVEIQFIGVSIPQIIDGIWAQ